MDIVIILFMAGYLIQDLSSLILIFRIKDKKSIEGLSLETQLMYFIGTLMRCVYVFDTRLINNYFIFFELLFSISLFCYIIHLFYKYRFTRFSEINSKFATWKLILPVCIVLSIFFHPGKNKF